MKPEAPLNTIMVRNVPHNRPVLAHRGISKQLKIVPEPGARLLSRAFDNTEGDMQILGKQLLAVVFGLN